MRKYEVLRGIIQERIESEKINFEGCMNLVEFLREKLAAAERELEAVKTAEEAATSDLNRYVTENAALRNQLSESQAVRVAMREALEFVLLQVRDVLTPSNRIPIAIHTAATSALTLDAQTPNPLLEALEECEKALSAGMLIYADKSQQVKAGIMCENALTKLRAALGK